MFRSWGEIKRCSLICLHTWVLLRFAGGCACSWCLPPNNQIWPWLCRCPRGLIRWFRRYYRCFVHLHGTDDGWPHQAVHQSRRKLPPATLWYHGWLFALLLLEELCLGESEATQKKGAARGGHGSNKARGGRGIQKKGATRGERRDPWEPWWQYSERSRG